MSTLKLKMISGLLLSGWFFISPASAQDTRDIMRRVFDRDEGKTQISRSKIATCRYVKKGKKLACSEKPRVKIMESIRKDYGEREKDTRSVMILMDPPGERGIGLLQYDYEDANRDSDQWMYLSALGKMRRIVSGNENAPKTGSLFGSEISYEDIEAGHLEDYVYKILKTVTYKGRPCWVMESLPTPRRAGRSNYSKSVQWIDQERYLVLKAVLYDRQGKLVKRITMRGVESLDGIWITRKMNVNNVQTKRITTMKTEAIAINIRIEDDFLTQRVLTDGAFRERKLMILRAQMK